jgi:hypothetical protein
MDHDGVDVVENPERWNGTLLKCPGCRLKFPFSAVNHPFERRALPPVRKGAVEPREGLVTHCPQCGGWVTLS